MLVWIIAIPAAFVLGSIPFGVLIARARGVDLRQVGSGNVGATNVGRALGPRWFAIVFVLDLCKGLLPTLASGWAAGTLGTLAIEPGDAWPWLGTMASAILGHMYSPFLGFRGGKGVATGLGAMLGVFPALTIPALFAAGVFAVVFALWRYVSAASIAAAVSLPAWIWMFFGLTRAERLRAAQDDVRRQGLPDLPTDMLKATEPRYVWPFLIASAAVAFLVVWRHRTNLARLASGTELRIGAEETGATSDHRDPSPGSGGDTRADS